MKKKSSLMILALSALLLAGCNPEAKSSLPTSIPESSTSSILPPESSSEEGMDKETALLYYYRRLLKPSNLTMSIKDPTGQTVVKYFMGSDAVVFDSNGEQEGILVNGTQGVFEFKVDSANNIILGQSYGRSTNVIDVFYTPTLLANERELGIWTIGDEGYFYTCSNKPGSSAFGAYATMLTLGKSSYISYLSSMTLKLADDLSSATLKLRYTLDGQVATVSATFSKFGNTSVKAVADYIKNPVTVPSATAYSSTATTIANALYGDATIAPFPTGLVDYAFRDDPLTDSSNHAVGFQWTYYGDNIASGWNSILTAKGYVSAQADTVDDDGYTHTTLKYVLREATAEVGEKSAVAEYWYDSREKEFCCQFSLFIGAVVSEIADISALNTKLALVNASEDVTYALPDFDANEAITKITFTDASEKFASDYSFYYYIEMDIADSAAAMTYLKAYETKLLQGSYQVLTSVNVTLDHDGTGVYFSANEQQTKYSLIELDHGTSNETTDYNGKIGIVFYGI